MLIGSNEQRLLVKANRRLVVEACRKLQADRCALVVEAGGQLWSKLLEAGGKLQREAGYEKGLNDDHNIGKSLILETELKLRILIFSTSLFWLVGC